MYLKRLEIAGFKSFAKKGELSFNVPISAIVGPNGSGKSNIAEAFRFVLGEQSIKSLRGKKGEDLIYNGGDAAARGNRASVAITFDNSSRFLDIDFDEVVVERIVYRDGVNEYLINGSVVRLKDVFELLSRAHIGPSGHHIISQGEADRILNANPRERKGMIEEALGLKMYQYKREESERKLEKTDENIKSVESLRREILPHLKFLKKQVEKVEQAIEMRGRLGTLYQEYLKRESMYLANAEAKIAAEKKPLTAELALLGEKLADAKAILAKSGSFDARSKEIIKLEDQLAKIRGEKDAIARDLGRVEGELGAEERMLKKHIAEHAGEATLVPLGDVEAIASQIDDAVTRAEVETSADNLKKILATVIGLVKNFVAKHKTAGNAVVREAEKSIARLAEQKKSLEGKLAAASADEHKRMAAYSELQLEIEREKDTNRDAEKRVFEIHAAQNDISSKLALIRAHEETLRIESDNFKRHLGEAGVLVGRDVLLYEEFQLPEDARVGGASDPLTEPRSAQEERRRAIEKIKIRLEDSGVAAGDDIMKEFNEVSERDAFLVRELDDLEKSAAALRELIVELEEKINTEFKEGIAKINKHFHEFFVLMFGGGSASLDITKSVKRRRAAADADTDISAVLEDGGAAADLAALAAEEDAEEGIDIQVSLPKKKIKGLMMLSGGERALTSIALIFAMSQVKPPPFIILDETDAALDEANSKKYGAMIANLAKLSQLILITHNRETMSHAGVLYGVTMLGGSSKLLSIQFDEAVAVAK